MNPWATQALTAYKNERDTFTKAYNMGIKSKLPCFALDIEDAKPKNKLLTELVAIYIAGIAFEGGADTTRYTLQGMIKILKTKAQAELDSVVGTREFPSRKHLDSVKYVNRTTKECVRWMSTAINGAIPHTTIKDDEYHGYRILTIILLGALTSLLFVSNCTKSLITLRRDLTWYVGFFDGGISSLDRSRWVWRMEGGGCLV
ncbi:hypothetical protein T440DRAFT_557952 [Plenodomus tracheiphilus IPT5]|uniref:Cytochrome P450 n=1 Tax=Plenodomus tracheiphilus IPT5 TaxID=1408161 RepID=A0A6A7AX28_9PLEO|nr:hypothetical protein T440DRAFT_557952 [Plenodomus tracheiphilus IPT5]